MSNKFIEKVKTIELKDFIKKQYKLKSEPSSNNVDFALCPFHNEDTASFAIYEDTNSFYCFGCQVGGDIIEFVRLKENLNFEDSVLFLLNLYFPSFVSDVPTDIKSRLHNADKEKNFDQLDFKKIINEFKRKIDDRVVNKRDKLREESGIDKWNSERDRIEYHRSIIRKNKPVSKMNYDVFPREERYAIECFLNNPKGCTFPKSKSLWTNAIDEKSTIEFFNSVDKVKFHRYIIFINLLDFLYASMDKFFKQLDYDDFTSKDKFIKELSEFEKTYLQQYF